MNLNEKLIALLGSIGIPVEQDEYEGNEKIYITFSYEDERTEVYADNIPYSDVVSLQIQLITPKNFNYFKLKRKIRSLLESADFSILSTRSFLGDIYWGTEKIRQTVFEVEYTELRQEDKE